MKKIISRLINAVALAINIVIVTPLILINKRIIKATNLNVKNYDNHSIMVLAPHIDDDIIGCGGLILKHLRKGGQVSIVYLTKGEKNRELAAREAMAKERKKEAFSVASMIGLDSSKLYFIGGRDGQLLEASITDELEEILEKERPQSIFLPTYLDTHIDHYATSLILMEIYARKPQLFQEVKILEYEAQSPITPFNSNLMVDISSVGLEKYRLLDLYKSQKMSFNFVKNKDLINGLAYGLGKRAEAFIRHEVVDYYRIISEFVEPDHGNYLSLRSQLRGQSNHAHLLISYYTSLKYKKYQA